MKLVVWNEVERVDVLRILIFYFSGVGNTKMVAKKMEKELMKYYEVSIVSMEHFKGELDLNSFDAMVIGFPTIHASPAKPMLDFLKQLPSMQKEMPTFLFTTCGLYSANTLRIFAREAMKKNLQPILNKSYRCAATDGTLLAPFMQFWFEHEKKLEDFIIKDCETFRTRVSTSYKGRLPRFKLYSILNYPNKVMGQHYNPTIYVHKEHCITCGNCIVSCPTSCIGEDAQGYPLFQKNQCIHCYRCIHHCPRKALSLSKKKTPSRTLYD